ncbi:MAG: ATP synthase subunit I [Polyangiaceae bacterium]|nr:ATP synthase subunit I [Polyangiaceae bacterium]
MSDEKKPGARTGGLDGTMRAAILSVAASAAVMTVIAAIAFGSRAALGVAIGGAIATANLYVFARIGEAFIGRRGRTAPWAVIAVLKLGALLGGIWFILKSGLVSGLALTIGYSALIIGITLGTLFGPKPPEDDPGHPPDEPA